MPEIKVVDQNNQQVGTRELKDVVFGLEADQGLVHRVFSALAHAQRAGTRSTKTRSDVSGGGRKPFKQKGTGRARQGSTRASHMRHGGTAHGPQTVDFSTRVNRKERRLALRLVLSDLLREGRLTIVDEFKLEKVSTKDFAKTLAGLEASSSVIVLADAQSEVLLSGRNLPHVEVVREGQLTLKHMLKHSRLLLTSAAVDCLEERLS